MANRALYPPILDSYMPAFQTTKGCDVYFSLSKFNSFSDFKSVHVSIVEQSTGMNVVNSKNDSNGRYRATGIILNVHPIPVSGEDNLYYFNIGNDDILNGWTSGWIYKIQIRLSTVEYNESTDRGQNDWINQHSSDFSEWSTVCTVKAIGRIDLSIPIMEYDSSNENDSMASDEVITLFLSTLDFVGRITSTDPSEILYQYKLKIFNEEEELIEDSGDIYASQYQDLNEFRYLIKYEFEDSKKYSLEFTYITNNGYTSTYKKEFQIFLVQIDRIKCTVITVDNDTKEILKDITSRQLEEEEGRIGLKLDSADENPYSGNICIRRSSSKDGFTKWTDIKIITVKEQIITNLPLFYDYTIESGVWYKYGVQSIDKDGNRGILIQSSPVMRNFDYSYLLGENNQQLKLMFNNTMGSYKIQLMESKTETIGGTYPIITRNGALRYRVFPLNGLISFWMDENNLFCNGKRIIYGNSEEVQNKYNEYNRENNIVQYDYIYEKEFRKLVLDFLYDGKPKLFKSPTEGNIIVRLTDINCTPTQSLDRMIYEFTSTGNELAEATYENYIKHNFINVGTWSSSFGTYDTKLGQLQMNFTPSTNIFEEIYKKYDSQGKNFGGYTKTLVGIHHIKITIEDKPLRIRNSAGELVVGNNFELNNQRFTIYNPDGIYEFDERLTPYTQRDKLYLLSSAEYEENGGALVPVYATIDFLYDIQSEVYEEKQVQTQEIRSGVGQIFGEYKGGMSIYKDIYLKYTLDWTDRFWALNALSSSIEIEANPGAVFLILDENDKSSDLEYHEINDTGVLRLYELNNITQIRYVGMRNKKTGEIDATKSTDVLVNYFYKVLTGTYKNL